MIAFITHKRLKQTLGSIALSLLIATPGWASVGCNFVNGGSLSGQKVGLDGTSIKTFSAGDILSVTLNLVGGAHLQVGTTLVNNASGTTKTYTFPSDGNYTIYWDARTATSAIYTVTCTPFSTQTSEPPQSVQATISRSQSEVVTTNVGARLNNLGSPVGIFRGPAGAGRTTPGVERGTPTTNGSANLAPRSAFLKHLVANAHNSSRANLWEQQTSRGTSLRELATLAHFDSSELLTLEASEQDDPTQASTRRSSLPAERPLTVWGHGSFTSADNSLNSTETDSRYHGDVWGYNLGADYRFSEQFYGGASIGFSQTDLSTGYNAGHYKENSWTFTPYAVYMPTAQFKLSAMAGFARGDIKLDRHDNSVTGKTDSNMWYAALKGSYDFSALTKTPLSFKTNLGFLMTNKTVNAYTESDETAIDQTSANTRQIKPGVEVSYPFDLQDNRLEPFVKGDFVYDFMNPTNGDSNAFILGGGVRATSQNGLSGSLETQSQLGRADYEEYSVSMLLAYSLPIGNSQAENQDSVQLNLQSDMDANGHSIGTGLAWTPADLPLSLSLRLNQKTSIDQEAKSYNALARMNMAF